MVPEIKCEYGVFDTIAECIDAALAAQKDLVENYTIADRMNYEAKVREAFTAAAQEFAEMEFEETGYGRVDDKFHQITNTTAAVPGCAYLPMNMFANNLGVTMEFFAPFGLIGALTPVTNPAATIVGNGVANLAAGNAMVFNAHPSGKVSTAAALQLFNKTIVENGGPNNLLTMVKIPTMDTLQEIIDCKDVALLIGTGGPNMVATLMKSGKKAICAGPGNPPTIVDDTADIEKAADGLLFSSSMNNNILCVAEKEYYVMDSVFDALRDALVARGCKLLTAEEANKVKATILMETPGSESGYSPVKKYVGKCANVILEASGVAVEGDPRLAIFETTDDDPLVQTEQMMPIIPMVRVKNFEEALEMAYNAEHGNKHSASIWTKDSYHATAMSRKMNTTIFAQNGPTMAALGDGGAGTTAPTIATPTGEGPTGPWTFLRKRRVAMADGLGYAL